MLSSFILFRLPVIPVFSQLNESLVNQIFIGRTYRFHTRGILLLRGIIFLGIYKKGYEKVYSVGPPFRGYWEFQL